MQVPQIKKRQSTYGQYCHLKVFIGEHLLHEFEINNVLIENGA
jgi:hypothetical protein